MKKLLPAILIGISIMLTGASATAATKTWSGSSGGNWNVAANWTNNVVPVNGDDLVFPANAAIFSTTNNLGLALNSITFNGSNYVLRGSAITLTNSVTDASQSGTSTIELPITLVTNAAINVSKFATLILAGAITGPGGITKTNSGTLTLSGIGNNYFGDTTVNQGILLLSAPGGEAIHENSVLTIGDGLGGASADIVRYSVANQINSGVRIVINSSGLLDLNGFSDTIGALTLDGGKVQTGSGIMTANGGITTLGVSTAASTVSGIVSLNFNLPLGVTNGPTGLGLNIPAQIRGSGGIVKNGPGQATLTASNSYSGLTTINAGMLRVEDDSALGVATNGTIVNSGGALVVGGLAGTLAEPLTLNGHGPSGDGAWQVEGGVDWNTNVVLASDTTISSTSSSILRINNSISGSANLTKISPGTLHYAGSAPNTYAGTTFVNEGRLELNKSALNVAIIGPLVIGGATGAPDSVVVQLQAATQIDNNAPVTINATGLFDQANLQDAVGSISGNGHINIGSAFLNVGINNSSTEFSGVISGISGDLSKLGAGTLTLSGTNTYTGTTTVSAGKLLVNGSQPQSLVSVVGGATLGGTGTVGTISCLGTVSPGNSPGVLTSSNVTFVSSSTFAVELNGPSQGTGYDALRARGTNSLANGALSLSVAGAFAPFESEPFTILENTGTEPLLGTFAGLPEGGLVSAGPLKFRISYKGILGNSVTLTFTNPPLAIISPQITGGNGNLAIDPNECNSLNLVLTNASSTPLSSIVATLSCSTPGVLVTQQRSEYPNVAVGGKATNTTPFQISTLRSFACGSTIHLNLRLETATANFNTTFPIASPASDGPPVRFDNNAAVVIPDLGAADSTNIVSGITNAIKKVTASVYVSSFNDQELTISLIGPDGTTVLLSAGQGATGDGYGTNCADASRTVFDDSATTSITSGPAPFIGAFRPQGMLATFAGLIGANVNGAWRLHIQDSVSGGSPTLHCWSLFVSPACADGGGPCDFCPGIFSGTIANSDPTQSAVLRGDDFGSSCISQELCPGVAIVTNVHYRAHSFTNSSSANLCVTAQLSSACGAGTAIYPVTYLGSFDPANVCGNFLAELGSALGPGVAEAYTFQVPANSVFIVIVSEANPGTGCTNYTLTVSGLDCPPPALDLAKAPANKVRIDWPTSAGGYLLESNPGLLLSNWTIVTNQPIVSASRFNVTNATATSNQFYRLRKPL